jgi:hypothetical protein
LLCSAYRFGVKDRRKGADDRVPSDYVTELFFVRNFVVCSSEHIILFPMSRDNDVQTLRGRLAVTRALWDHEREQILEVLGLEINPRAWSTAALVEEITDCIAGRKMIDSISLIEEPPANPVDVSLHEIEDWLNDIPLFE